MTTDERIESLAAKIDERFNRVEERLDRVDERFNRIDDYLLHFRREAIERLEALERQFSLLSNSVGSIDSRLPVLHKEVVELELFAGRLLREKPEPVVSQWYERLTRLEERVAKLISPAA